MVSDDLVQIVVKCHQFSFGHITNTLRGEEIEAIVDVAEVMQSKLNSKIVNSCVLPKST